MLPARPLLSPLLKMRKTYLAIKYDGKGLDALSFEVLIMFAGIKKAAS